MASGAGSAGGTGGMLTGTAEVEAAGCKTVIGRSTEMKVVECALGLNGVNPMKRKNTLYFWSPWMP